MCNESKSTYIPTLVFFRYFGRTPTMGGTTWGELVLQIIIIRVTETIFAKQTKIDGKEKNSVKGK